ncbi:MAG: hypothetical protein PVH77_04330 [Phycisphaerales bacterium]|jgi:hypothetical protein
MKYEISVSNNNEYIHISVDESATVDVVNRIISEMAEKAKEYEVKKFLYDVRKAPNRINPAFYSDLVYKRAGELGFVYGSKHAIVADIKDMPDYHFIETILNNAGYLGRLFTDETEAVEWLINE